MPGEVVPCGAYGKRNQRTPEGMAFPSGATSKGSAETGTPSRRISTFGTLCATHTKGTDDVQQCITSSGRQRTQESCIRKNGKADVEACIRYWNMYRKSVVRPSVRAFARMIGEKPSTVRYILKKGTTADRLTWYLPDQKRWEYFDLSPEFAVEETRRRNANKGPRGKVSNFFVRDFAKRYAKTKSVTYTLKVLHEISPNAYLPSRSTVYRLMDKGELRDARGRPLTHRRYKKNRRKPASTDVAPSHRARTFPDGHRPFFRRPWWHPHPCRPPPWRSNSAPPLLYVRPSNQFSSLRDLRASSLSPRPSRQRP